MSSNATVNNSDAQQITNTHTKMLSDINNITTESIHDINPTHNQMIQTQQKVHQLPLSDDPRTLQLALELSLVGLNESNQNSFVQSSIATQNDYELSSMNLVSGAYARNDMSINNLPPPLTSSAGSTSASLSVSAPANGSGSVSGLLMPSAGLEDRSKKSQNMTECVPVPSSEHVAEIVGRQGCKIKALRAKTNTYIKTPVRGEEPVFVVTGRKEDVSKAKREILSAADHFSLIRASRKPSMEGSNGSNGSGCIIGNGNGSNTGSLNQIAGIVTRTQSGPPCLPGQITIQVRVPYRVVGLVVGPKGATIKHIQQETQTYIVTPSREKEPIFEVTGLPDNVETARKQIEAHIALRTGNSAQGSAGSENGTESIDSNEYSTTLHTLNTLSQILNDDINSDILSSIYNIDTETPSNYPDAHAINISNQQHSTGSTIMNHPSNISASPSVALKANLDNTFSNSELINTKSSSLPPLTLSGSVCETVQLYTNTNNNSSSLYRNTGVPKTLTTAQSAAVSANVSAQCHLISANILTRSCSSASSTASTKSTNNSANSTNSSVNTPPELLNIWKNLNDSIDVDEGIGDSPSIWNLASSNAVNVNVANASASHCSPTASISPTDSLLGEHSLSGKNTVQKGHSQDESTLLLHHHHQQHQHQHPLQIRPTGSPNKLHRECFVCNEREVTTALVPCGHNMFCMHCANQICVSMESICPICHSIVYHAMRILA